MAKIQPKIDSAKLSHTDDREKIIKTVKAEEKSMHRYAEAEEIFGTKRWEDDWLRIFHYAATAGYLGNLISIVLGVSGGIFLCYQLTSNWAAAIAIGVVVVLIMEIAKSVSLREATVHLLKEKALSGMILAGIAGTMIVASAYFSVESGVKTPYFQKWVQSETATTLPIAPTTNEYATKIADLRGELRAIDNERDAYLAKNPSKTAKWLKADRYENLKAEIATLQKEAATNTAEAQATTLSQANAQKTESLSWWYWAIVLLSECCVLFGYTFRPYYLYRCRELAIAEGKELNREEIEVTTSATTYTPIQQQQSNEQLLAEIERLKKLHGSNPTNTNPTNKIGFQMPINNVDTVSTHKDTHIVATNKGNNSVDTVSTPDYTQLDEATLLGHYRQLNSNIKSWQTRQTDTARQNIANSQALQVAILDEMRKRGKTIEKVSGKGYQVVVAILAIMIGMLIGSEAQARNRSGGMDTPNTITLHHSGCSSSSCTVEGIKHDHMSVRGWTDIGYHFIVDEQGIVHRGRSLTTKGAHVAYHNTNNIGICILGNLNEKPMNSRQFISLQILLQRLVYTYGITESRVMRHKDFNHHTDCPGKYFPNIRQK